MMASEPENPGMVTINIMGKFTKEELVELLQKVRDIERRKEGTVYILVKCPDLTAAEVAEITDGIKPPLPYKEVFSLSEGKQKADQIYARFKGKLEAEHFGKIVAIDTDLGEIVGIGDDIVDAYNTAKEKTSKTKFAFRRVG